MHSEVRIELNVIELNVGQKPAQHQRTFMGTGKIPCHRQNRLRCLFTADWIARDIQRLPLRNFQYYVK